MKGKFRIFSIIFFLALICLTPMLSGCFSTCKKLVGLEAADFVVYLNGEPLSRDNDCLMFDYGEVGDLRQYIKVKELTIKDEEKEPTEDFRLEMTCEINSETTPGLFGVDVYYKDLKPKHFYVKINSLATEITLNLKYENEYGDYELPKVNEDLGRPYILYCSTDRYGRNKTEWTSNTQLVPGYYYGWAEIESTQIYGPGTTYPKGFRIVENIVDVPTPKMEYTYTGSEIVPEFEGFNPQFMTQNTTATIKPGRYSTTFKLKQYHCWSDGTKENKEVKWTINKAKVPHPTVIDTLVYNKSQQTVVLDGFNEEIMRMAYGYRATNAGEYTVTIVLRDSSCYEWESTNANELNFKWTIKKANYTTCPTFNKQLATKKASNLSGLTTFFENGYSLYRDSNLPSGVTILDSEWLLADEQDFSDYTLTTYHSQSENGIYWVKEVTTTSNTQTTQYYQAGILDGALESNMLIYLTYNADKLNYNNATTSTHVLIKQKYLHTISLNEQSINSAFNLNTQTNRYEIVYNKNLNSFIGATSSTSDYKIIYKNLSKDNEITDGAKDVGVYEVWAEIAESEDNYFVTTEKYSIEVLAGTISGLTNLTTSEIYYSQKLSDSTITANVDYLGEIEGIFTWLSPDTMPQVSDSKTTVYSFVFTPKDTNILPFTSQTTLTINKAQITSYVEPTLDDNATLYADKLVKDVVLGVQGKAYFNQTLVEGEWNIQSEGRRLQNKFKLIFTPSDSNYETLIIEKTASNTPTLVTVSYVRHMIKPTLHAVFSDGNTYRVWHDGTATIRAEYSNGIWKDFSISEVDSLTASSNSYRLVYAGVTSSAYSSNSVKSIYTEANLENAMASESDTYYLIKGDLTLSKSYTSSTNKLIAIQSGVTLNLNGYELNFTNSSSPNCVFNCGTIISTENATVSFTNLKQIVNYGNISLSFLYSDYTTIDNYSTVTMLKAANVVKVGVNNLSTTSTFIVEERGGAYIGGKNYGTVISNANNTIIDRLHYNYAGSTFKANHLIVSRFLDVYLDSTLEISSIKISSMLTYEVNSIESFKTALSYLTSAPNYVSVVLYKDIDLTNCDDIANGDTTSESNMKLYVGKEITLKNHSTFNLGGKTLVLHYTESVHESRVNGNGEITNGKIIYNYKAVGSSCIETDVVTCNKQNITFEDANTYELTVTSQDEFFTTLSNLNGKKANIIVDCDIIVERNLELLAPLTITIKENRVFKIAKHYNLLMKYNENGESAKIIAYGSFSYSAKVQIYQYNEDYTKNSFSILDNIEIVGGSTFSYYKHYLIKTVDSLETLKSLATTTSYTVLNVTKDITLDSDITFSQYCIIQFTNGSINISSYTLTLEKFSKVISIGRITSSTRTGRICYSQDTSVFEIMSNSNVTSNVLDLDSISTTIKEVVSTLDVINKSNFYKALAYAEITVPTFHEVNINLMDDVTLTENITLPVSDNYRTVLSIQNGYTIDLDGYTLTIPNKTYQLSSTEINSNITINNGATLTNGIVKLPAEYNTNLLQKNFVTIKSGGTVTNITYSHI